MTTETYQFGNVWDLTITDHLFVCRFRSWNEGRDIRVRIRREDISVVTEHTVYPGRGFENPYLGTRFAMVGGQYVDTPIPYDAFFEGE